MARARGTGSKRKRGNVWWTFVYHNGKLVPESTGTSDEKEAEKILNQRWKAANTTQFVAPTSKKLLVDDLIDLARKNAERKGNKSAWRYGTIEKPDASVKHLLETFGGRPARTITTSDIEKYIDERLKDGATIATINRETAKLRRGYKLAIRDGLLTSMPIISNRSEAGNEREGFIEPALFDGLLDQLRTQEPVLADITEAGFFTLLRRSNVTGLRWDMIHGDQLLLPGTQTKNKRALALPITGRLQALLERRQSLRNGPYVFHRDGKKVGRFDKAWDRAVTAINQPKLLFHDLRRSGAREFIRQGVPEDVVLKLGNWKTRSMLTRYNIVSTKDLAEAQEKLTAAFSTKAIPLVRKAS
jgi:integrase